ncbi:Crp/Fnr family transcriptional regulator [Natronoglycomyces albus]|uniref:Crp/Fnr family transcriptional regulator n=1 Tax=Natronoglycomyces albus TaxID=2811108 RepID=A0A895XVT3_9ACTN|nr:Crp/Fnr family transcriptional regulator [Natronoglycomyces albus]QSB06330.1 Crp/Fnr family transcriptional regulator [Natronoglycomyces albus]
MGVTPSEDPLGGVAMFSGLDLPARQRIAEVAVPRHYHRGRLLFFEGEPAESLIMIRSGAVSVFRTAATGERAMLHVARPPEVLGEVSLLDSSPRSASAEALEDTTALALARSSFIEMVHSNPKMLDAVMRSMGMLVRRLTEQSSDHVFLDLPGRVAKTLVRLAERHPSPIITIELNQTQLAEMAGGSRQSVNQAIGIFANRGWLRTEGRKIVVTDLAALRKRAGFPPEGGN